MRASCFAVSFAVLVCVPFACSGADIISSDQLAFVGVADSYPNGMLLTPAIYSTSGDGALRGAAWLLTPQNLRNGFDTTFSFAMTAGGNKDGPTYSPADGFAFVLHNDPNGSEAIGGEGSSMGYAFDMQHNRAAIYPGITKGVAVEFDVFTNNQDAYPEFQSYLYEDYHDPIWGPQRGANNPNEHIGVMANANGQLSADHRAAPQGDGLALSSQLAYRLNDGGAHTARITYTPGKSTPAAALPGTLNVYLDGNLLIRGVAIDLDSFLTADGLAWVGFTAGSGNGYENHIVTNWTFAAAAPPAPVLNDVKPNTAMQGDPGISPLTATGTNFIAGARILWNATPLPTDYVSGTTLTASVSRELLAQAGTVNITVVNPDGQTSGAKQFIISPPIPAPVITSLNPPSTVAGHADLPLTITGSGFLATSKVMFDNAPLAVGLNSDGTLQVTVPATLLISPRKVNVVVDNGVGGVSAPALFEITVPPATVTGLSPTYALVGSADTPLIISGTGFTARSLVQFGGDTTLLTPTRVDPNGTSLTVTVPAVRLGTAGSFQVVVVNPGVTVSNSKMFAIVPEVSVGLSQPTVNPTDTPQLSITFNDEFSVPIHGVVTLSFESEAVDHGVDQQIKFEGTNPDRFEFDASSPGSIGPMPMVQVGTVAGTINFAVELTTVNGTPIDQPTPTFVSVPESIRIPLQKPTIMRACLVKTSAGFDMQAVGYSTPRQVTGITFGLTPVSGASLATATLSPSDGGTKFAQWYQNPDSQTVGSQFKLVQSFNVQGDVNAIQSVSVKLRNDAGGDSDPAVANFQSPCP